MDYVCVCCVLYVGRLSLEKGDGGPHFVPLEMHFSLLLMYTHTHTHTCTNYRVSVWWFISLFRPFSFHINLQSAS